MSNEWMLRRHIFLTGARQVGKSTILRGLMKRRGLDCAGFETQPFYIGDERRGFTLHGRVNMPPYENNCIVCVRVGEQRSVPVLPVFEENGVDILKRSLDSESPWLLMDELGRLEREAARFCAQVLACLDSGKRVLGVLQACDAPLVCAVRAREDVSVIEVTPENREEVLDRLCRAL